eukprot:Selendium_serpulae@DN6200_c2_g1_i17.p2
MRITAQTTVPWTTAPSRFACGAHKIRAHAGNDPLPKDSSGNPTITIGLFPEVIGEVFVVAHVDTCETPPIDGGGGDGDAASTKPADGATHEETEPTGGDGDAGQTEPAGEGTKPTDGDGDSPGGGDGDGDGDGTDEGKGIATEPPNRVEE